MWRKVIFLLPVVFLRIAAAFTDNTVQFSIDYFNYRGIKSVCLLTCKNEARWTTQFTKIASNNSIAVSFIQMDSNWSENTTVQCLQLSLLTVGVMIEAACDKTAETLYYASDMRILDDKHKWLIIDDDEYFPEYSNATIIDNVTHYQGRNEMLEVFGELNISVDADIILASRVNSTSYNLYDIFNFGKIQGGDLMVDLAGTWDSNGIILIMDLNKYKYYRRWNFQNWTMRMILVVTPAPKNFDTSLLKSFKPIPGVATITHTGVAIVNVIAEIHNYSYIHTITDRWIGPFDRKSKRVVCNTLYFREQDISPLIRFQGHFYDYIDYISIPATSIETRYFYRIPTTGTGKFENQFLRPLSPQAWWSVIGVSVLCALVLLMAALFENRPSSLQYAIFSVTATICQQFFDDIGDSDTKRMSSARKVTILVTGLSCVLIYNYYTSSVVSWLLSGPPPTINSLRELLESPLELIYEDIGYTRSWLQNPTYYYNKRNAKIEDEIRQKKVLNKKQNAPLLIPPVDGIKMVQKGGYAYHTEINNANDLISKTFTQMELCELGSLGSMEKTALYPCTQKNSPYKEFITWSMMRLLERGIVFCIQARTAANEVRCEGSSPRALALGGAAPAFILLAGGYILAIMFMFIERLIYKMKIQKRGVSFLN